MPRPMRTMGKRMSSQRSSTSAIGGRVATNLPGPPGTATNAHEEDNAVGDYCERFHAEEYRGVDTDVVAAIGKRDACDCPNADLLAGNLGLVVIVVIVSAPGLPCGPEADAQRPNIKFCPV